MPPKPTRPRCPPCDRACRRSAVGQRTRRSPEVNERDRALTSPWLSWPDRARVALTRPTSGAGRPRARRAEGPALEPRGARPCGSGQWRCVNGAGPTTLSQIFSRNEPDIMSRGTVVRISTSTCGSGSASTSGLSGTCALHSLPPEAEGSWVGFGYFATFATLLAGSRHRAKTEPRFRIKAERAQIGEHHAKQTRRRVH
jgi:hypothetical protein